MIFMPYFKQIFLKTFGSIGITSFISVSLFAAGGHGVVTLGSKATVVRNAIVEKIKVVEPISFARFKLRPDPPQVYEKIHYRKHYSGKQRGRCAFPNPSVFAIL